MAYLVAINEACFRIVPVTNGNSNSNNNGASTMIQTSARTTTTSSDESQDYNGVTHITKRAMMGMTTLIITSKRRKIK